MKGWRADILLDGRLLAYRRGGISRYVASLEQWLPSIAPDLSISLVANRPSGNSALPVTRVFTPPHHRIERASLGAELSLRLPRLVHSPDFIAPITIGPKRVVTVHDLAFLTHPEFLDEPSRRYYGQFRRSVEVADRVIAVSDYTANELKRLTRVDPGRVVTILNGIDSDPKALTRELALNVIREKLDQSTHQRLLSNGPLLLSVGTIEPRKRQKLLLDATRSPEITERDPRPLLLLIGEPGWQCAEVVAEIRTRAQGEDVVWLSNVDDELLSALYIVATIVLAPSVDEGFGLPLLEAMQAGTPVIASDRGAFPEVSGEAAMLISSDDPGDWAAAIACLLEDGTAREEMRVRGLKRAARFSWERTASQTAEVYREVLGR